MMADPCGAISKKLQAAQRPAGMLTFGECIHLAIAHEVSVGTAVLAEAMATHRLSTEKAVEVVISVFDRNRQALEIGRCHGKSRLMGSVGAELAGIGAGLTGHRFLDKAITYTLATQVGNHCIGLQPCAGTGDACTYTGLFQAMMEELDDQIIVARAAAVMLKLGVLFREGKSTTGCNMEGFGAGAAAAAVFTELADASPAAMERAVVLAMSPTIAVPCTPRVMVPGLCATHLGGGVLVGWLASRLACVTLIPVDVPVDVMMALAAAVHPISASAVVPEVVRHMAPFFQTRAEIDKLVTGEDRNRDLMGNQAVLKEARERTKAMARRSRSILNPFAAVVVGGSSQAVGSPVNAARIAHHLARGTIRRVSIVLGPELFARRTLNSPGILAAAVYGSATDDNASQAEIFQRLQMDAVKVFLKRSDQAGLQRIEVEAERGNAVVTTLNRGGGRIYLVDAQPSLDEARRIASVLQIELAE